VVSFPGLATSRSRKPRDPRSYAGSNVRVLSPTGWCPGPEYRKSRFHGHHNTVTSGILSMTIGGGSGFTWLDCIDW